jgi:hypothetical protein
MIGEFVRNPPSWLVAVIVAVLVSHALDKLIEVVRQRPTHNGLVPIMELFSVFVLSFLALHAYYEGVFKGKGHSAWYEGPFALVVTLCVFALASIGLYLVLQAQPRRRLSREEMLRQLRKAKRKRN